MKLSTKLAGCLALALGTSSFGAFAADACEVDRAINFGGMSWDSNLVMVDIERFILENGYGCKTQVQAGESVAILAGLQRGDVDVMSEVWSNSLREPWEKALKTGKVKTAGEAYQGEEAWYVPRYTAERFPELKAASDLPKFKDKFADPEEPGKGRFYGCPAGWGCDATARNLFKAFELGESFTYYSPGTAAAQRAAITSAYKRKRDIVFYYWVPTPLVGELDLVKLDMPPYDEAAHQCNTSADCADPKPSAYPQNPVLTALNSEFSQQAPKLAAFFAKVNVAPDELNKVLAWANAEGAESDETARQYLREYPQSWSQWLPEDVAERVKQAL
ncbi:ABC transporter substrate-binding protein [Pseudomonas sp. GOM6]|uniref:ABC transporter substrate-binding protein n=1 Tax=Pseudomonas sp. GOM6 TaxID=3036944 RepID=UPI00240A3556|nr:ABC transporter substrate-binding protein [Pseudomonas sp. GOM6]MDG1579811.1 ABC transporter substrate-binding protein [Pseudomonas sp. GOM6]